MSSSRRLLALTLGSVAFLSGCARDTRDYPSLAPRAVEQRGFAEPQAKPEPVQADPALDTRIVEMGQSLSNLAAAFDRTAAVADAAARRAHGQAVGSDAWLDAQARLAELDDHRAQTSSLVTDIDQMIADRAATLAPVYAPLAELRDAAVAEAARQGTTIDRIEAMLPAG